MENSHKHSNKEKSSRKHKIDINIYNNNLAQIEKQRPCDSQSGDNEDFVATAL